MHTNYYIFLRFHGSLDRSQAAWPLVKRLEVDITSDKEGISHVTPYSRSIAIDWNSNS